MVALFVVYTLLSPSETTKLGNLRREGSEIIKQLISGSQPPRIVDGNIINESKLVKLKNFSHEELKRSLRVGSDFCLYFEDEKGNFVLINNSFKGIGSPNIYLKGTPCSQK